MEKELTVAIEAAKEAGRTIRHIHDSSSWTVENKADGKGPLTEADLASNDILMAALTSAFPEDGIDFTPFILKRGEVPRVDAIVGGGFVAWVGLTSLPDLGRGKSR